MRLNRMNAESLSWQVMVAQSSSLLAMQRRERDSGWIASESYLIWWFG
jgi:hypothetical protein